MKWLERCQEWKRKYPVCLPEYEDEQEGINSYHFIDRLSDIAPDDAVIVTDMGTSFTGTHQGWKVKKGQRLYTSGGHASMGWGLPGAIGAYCALNRPVILITGDGGIMMNLQELATIAKHKMRIAIFLLDNDGYLTIKHMQNNHFGRYVGSTEDSGLGFPDWGDLANAFGIALYNFPAAGALGWIEQVGWAHMFSDGPFMSVIPMPHMQPLIPRNTSEKRPDGTIVSKPIEDMYPFLDRKEFADNMIVKPVEVLE